MNPFPHSTAEAELELALVEIEQQLHFCDKSREACSSQEATAFLLKGAIASSRANRVGANSADKERYNRAALNHFLRVLELDPDDVDALEYVAHHQRVLGQVDLAIASYERLANITGGSARDDRLIAARANRHIAELYEYRYDENGVAQRLEDAREHLDEALDRLPHSAKGTIEEGRIQEVYGRVVYKLGFNPMPLQRWGQAQALYNNIRQVKGVDREEAEAGYHRVKGAIDAFTKKQDAKRDAGRPPNPTPPHTP